MAMPKWVEVRNACMHMSGSTTPAATGYVQGGQAAATARNAAASARSALAVPGLPRAQAAQPVVCPNLLHLHCLLFFFDKPSPTFSGFNYLSYRQSRISSPHAPP